MTRSRHNASVPIRNSSVKFQIGLPKQQRLISKKKVDNVVNVTSRDVNRASFVTTGGKRGAPDGTRWMDAQIDG